MVRRSVRIGSVAVGVCATLLGLSGQAAAGSFSQAGVYAFDEAASDSFDFENGAPPPVNEEDPPITVVESPTALSGSHVVEVMPFGSADLLAELPSSKHSYRVSLWIRGGDTVGFFVTAHGEDTRAAEIATLYPTGRMTSDGWVELANSGIRFDGERSMGVVGVFSPGGCEMDAVEIVAEGDLSGELNASCDGVVGSSACLADQVCYWSECRNMGGWVPPIPQNRQAATEYLANRFRFHFGPFANRTLDMPASLSAVEAMKSADTPWAYWNNYLLAIRRLHDGHTSTSSLANFAIDNPKPLNVCFLEGDADLSQSLAPSDPLYRDVVVSHTGPDHNLGLKAGDRLVSVDGMHPIAWSRSLIDRTWSHPAISNHETFAEHASRLRASISRWAHEVVVIRCDPNTNACSPPETISIADVPFDPPDAEVDVVACDNRPLRHLVDSPANHSGGFDSAYVGIVNESDSTEKIYGVEWESLSTTNGNDGVGAALNAALDSIDAGGANGAILDHRTGTGGTIVGPAIVWNWAVPNHLVSFTQTRQRAEDEQPSTAEGLSLFNLALQSNQVVTGGSGAATNLPVALLITQDVSASDWLPLGLKGAAPNVRIFGPYQTNGAFSTRYQFSYWLGMSAVMATGDTFVPDGSTQAGHGVEPDVVVLPKQSDLLVGKDTVFEAAIAWIRQEMQP
jgi:Peptidase family S41